MEYTAGKAYLVCYKGDSSIFDKLIRIVKDTDNTYTHVGIYVPTETVTDPESISYYACREDAGVALYTEDTDQLDLYEIKPKNNRCIHVEAAVEESKYLKGSMIADMGYRELRARGSMSSTEWVACVLDLAFPPKYTISKLIDYANLE